jgi:hypothetical protein
MTHDTGMEEEQEEEENVQDEPPGNEHDGKVICLYLLSDVTSFFKTVCFSLF